MTPLDVLVVVVTHDSRDALPAFADGLRAGMAGVDSWHLVVSDNASTDGSADLAQALLPEASVLRHSGNRGYAAGINAAVAAAPPCRTVLVLNPDVRLGVGCASTLLAALDGSAGIAVPQLFELDGTPAWSLRRAPSVSRALGESVLGGRRAARWRCGELVAERDRPANRAVVDWATGAAWLVRTECFDALSGFDEAFFLYSEETDFALRARARGYTVVSVPDATAVHGGGRSNTDPALYALMTRNRVECYGRRHGPAPTLAFRVALLAGELARSGTRPTSRAATLALLGARSVLPEPYRRVRTVAHRQERGSQDRTGARLLS
jgi:GT2 family glycosyltransferase